jgi:hypothetical protein
MSIEEELKFNEFQAFIVITKGFCAINFLILPRIMSYGGWLIGSITILSASLLVGISATKLVQSGVKTGIMTY